MKELEERIRKDGVLVDGTVLKVDSFLNHQIDSKLLHSMALEWKRLYEGVPVDKVLTIEASGIAMASFAAYEFGVPLLFAKKSRTINLSGTVYSTKVESFTHNRTYDVIVNKKYLKAGENVLIIDDFLANGQALLGLIDLCRQAGANIAGCGICIEKAFQPGGARIREMGYRVESLARIKSPDMSNGIEFCD